LGVWFKKKRRGIIFKWVESVGKKSPREKETPYERYLVLVLGPAIPKEGQRIDGEKKTRCRAFRVRVRTVPREGRLLASAGVKSKGRRDPEKVAKGVSFSQWEARLESYLNIVWKRQKLWKGEKSPQVTRRSAD